MATQPLEYVFALYNFDAENPDEVSFKVGERVLVVEKDEAYGDGWFQGTNERGETGLFPFSYTTYDEAAARMMLNGINAQAMGTSSAQESPQTAEPEAADAGAADTADGQGGVLHSTMNDIDHAISELRPHEEDTLEDFGGEADFENDLAARAAAREALAKNARESLAQRQREESAWGNQDHFGMRSLTLNNAPGVTPLGELEMSDESEDEDDMAAAVAEGQLISPTSGVFSAGTTDERAAPSDVPSDVQTASPKVLVSSTLGMTELSSMSPIPTDPSSPHTAPPAAMPQPLAAVHEDAAPVGYDGEQPFWTPSKTNAPADAPQDAQEPQPVLDVPQTPETHTAEDEERGTYSSTVAGAASLGAAAFSAVAAPLAAFAGVGDKKREESHEVVQPTSPAVAQEQCNSALDTPEEPSLPGAFTSTEAHAARPPTDLPRDSVSPSAMAPSPVSDPNGLPAGNPVEWNVETVVAWATWKKYDANTVEKLAQHEISGDALLSMDVNMLKEIDITAFGRRFHLANGIKELRQRSEQMSAGLPAATANTSTSPSVASQPSVVSPPPLAMPTQPMQPSPVVGSVPQTPYDEMRSTSALSTSIMPPPTSSSPLGLATGPQQPFASQPVAQHVAPPPPQFVPQAAAPPAVPSAPESAAQSAPAAAKPLYTSNVMPALAPVASPATSLASPAAAAASPRANEPARPAQPRPTSVSVTPQPVQPPPKLRPAQPPQPPKGEPSRQPKPFMSPPPPLPVSLPDVHVDTAPAPGSGASPARMGAPRPVMPAPLGSSGGRTPSGAPPALESPAPERRGIVGLLRPHKEPRSPAPRGALDKSQISMPTSNTEHVATAASADEVPVLSRLGSVDMQGWVKKRGDRYNTWNTRYLVLKGSDLLVLRDPSATKVKSHINMHGYKVVLESTATGLHALKLLHDTERTHVFSVDSEVVLRQWVKAMMKSTIGRDASQPVISSYSNATISLAEAQRLRPRPPSPTSRTRMQREHGRDNTNRLTTKDASVLMALDKQP